jgi:hypothetical protein
MVRVVSLLTNNLCALSLTAVYNLAHSQFFFAKQGLIPLSTKKVLYLAKNSNGAMPKHISQKTSYF